MLYKELAVPRRALVTNNKEDIIKFINRNNGIVNLYITVYQFRELNGNKKPDYQSAVIDKIFFDFDSNDCYEQVLKLHKFLLLNDIKHTVSFSGRGFHIFVFVKGKVKNKKAALFNCQKSLIDELNLNVDKQILGDIARIYRIQNTYNIRRKKFCIPLNEKQLRMGFEKIKELANKQNFIKNIIFGNKEINITEFDTDRNMDFGIGYNKIDFKLEDLEKMDFKLNIDLPVCIKNLLAIKKLGYDGRFILILYLREKGLTIKEIIKVLKDNLSKSKFYHCVFEERQAQYLFNRPDLLMSNCSMIKIKGFCPFNNQNKCKLKDKVYEV